MFYPVVNSVKHFSCMFFIILVRHCIYTSNFKCVCLKYLLFFFFSFLGTYLWNVALCLIGSYPVYIYSHATILGKRFSELLTFCVVMSSLSLFSPPKLHIMTYRSIYYNILSSHCIKSVRHGFTDANVSTHIMSKSLCHTISIINI